MPSAPWYEPIGLDIQRHIDTLWEFADSGDESHVFRTIASVLVSMYYDVAHSNLSAQWGGRISVEFTSGSYLAYAEQYPDAYRAAVIVAVEIERLLWRGA